MDTDTKKRNHTHGTGLFARHQFKSLGENVILENGILVFHPETISIGNNVYIGHHTILKGYYKNALTIDDHTWIGQGCFFHSAGGISIGAAVGIGPGVRIISSQHGMEDPARPVLYHEIEFAPVVIASGSDIGMGAIILPGVTIGEGAVVGAGAVVTRGIPPYAVAVGNPARVIKHRKDTRA